MKDALQLQSGEQIILTFRKHWFVLFLRLLAVFVLGVAPFLIYAPFHFADSISGLRAAHVFQFAGFWWLLITWWSLSVVCTQYYLEMWVVTNRRVVSMEQVGLFDREVTAWGIERILEATVHIGNIVQTFLNYGTLEIHTAGTNDAHEKVYGVPDPSHVREVIIAQASRVGTLEEANRNQEQLLHTISHEVKSYLAKDAASLATIAEGDIGVDPLKVQDFAKSALTETRKGVSAVMEMLQGSDAKTGAMTISNSAFDLRPIVEQITADFKPLAEKKGLTVSVFSPQGYYMVRGDEMKLRDLVLRNLIDNAIRYTSHGEIGISLTKKSDAAVFSVTDSGVGISQDDMAKLFMPGGSGRNSRQINPESTGFGLASAKQLLDILGGTIIAESPGEGQGSTFTVKLPLADQH